MVKRIHFKKFNVYMNFCYFKAVLCYTHMTDMLHIYRCLTIRCRCYYVMKCFLYKVFRFFKIYSQMYDRHTKSEYSPLESTILCILFIPIEIVPINKKPFDAMAISDDNGNKKFYSRKLIKRNRISVNKNIIFIVLYT